MAGDAKAPVSISALLALFISVCLAGCGGQPPSPALQQTSALPQGTFIYVGEKAASPDSVFPTSDMDALASYQVQADGSLKRLGAFDRSALPAGIFESAAAGPWLFTCDSGSSCQEFKVDNTGNLVRGTDLASVGLHQIAGIDPTGTWLIGSTIQGEQAFRIQPDGTLVPGPATPVPPPAPPASPDILGFFIISFDPTGNFVLAKDTLNLSDPAGVFRFDAMTGAFTRVSTLPPDLTVPGFNFLGFTSDGQHALGVQNSTEETYVFDWDSNTGTLTVHSHNVFTLKNGAVLFPGFMAAADNFIFIPQVSESVVLRFDPASATLSDTGQSFPNNAVENGPVHADPHTHTLVGTDFGGNLIGVWKYDPATGAATTVPGSPYAAGLNPEIVGVFAH